MIRPNSNRIRGRSPALRRLLLCGALSVCAFISGSVQAGVIVERIAAVVNDEVLTQSEVVVEFHLKQGKVSAPEQGDLMPILEQLINREIIYQEIQRYEQIELEEEEIGQALEVFRRSYPHPENLDRILEADGVSEEELVNRQVKKIVIEKFLNERFLPYIQVTPEDIETFYQQEFIPQLREKGEVRIPPLEDVSDRLEAMFRERKFNESVEEWINGLREKSNVLILLDE